MSQFLYQPKSFQDACKDFSIRNFKVIFLEAADKEYRFKTGLRFKFRRDLNLPPQTIKSIFKRSREINYPISVEYLLACMIESKKSKFIDVIIRISRKFQIDTHIAEILEIEKPSIVSITYDDISCSSEILTHNIFNKLTASSAYFTILELTIPFSLINHLCNNSSYPHDNTGSFIWSCPNLKQLSLSNDNALSNQESIDLFEVLNISFPPENLQELFLSKFTMTHSVLKHLKYFESLEKLSLNEMTGGTFSHAIESMSCLIRLKWLQFSGNDCAIVYNSDMNELMKKLIHCLPDLNYIDVSETALMGDEGKPTCSWLNERHFSYLGIASSSYEHDDLNTSQTYLATLNSAFVGWYVTVPGLIELLKRADANSELFSDCLDLLKDSNLDFQDFHMKYFCSITEILCRGLNRHYYVYCNLLAFLVIFLKMVKIGLSGECIQMFLDEYFQKDLSDVTLHIRSRTFLYCIQSCDHSAPEISNLLQDGRWANALFNVPHIPHKTVLEVISTYHTYYSHTKRPLPYICQFLKALFSNKCQQDKPTSFIKLLIERHEECHSILENISSSKYLISGVIIE